jgi:glyoxylase-like metal-dependent hydrolase (beta-lactamase superfamily II)
VSGRVLPFIGSHEPWASGAKTDSATCLLAPNPSPMTLDGTNTWILRDQGAAGCVLVDPGPADERHRAAIHAATLDSPVRMILLTHGHGDHSDLARDLAADTGAAVRALDPGHRLGDEGLDAGDVVSVGSLDIHVVSSPGHTSDSVCFLIPREGSLLTGDTVLGRGTSLVAWPDGRLEDYLLSLERLQELVEHSGVTRLLPGHGPILHDPASILRAYREHRVARLDEVRSAVVSLLAQQCPDTVGQTRSAIDPMDVVAVVYAAVPREVWPAAALSVRAQLDYLYQRGELRRP